MHISLGPFRVRQQFLAVYSMLHQETSEPLRQCAALRPLDQTLIKNHTHADIAAFL